MNWFDFCQNPQNLIFGTFIGSSLPDYLTDFLFKNLAYYPAKIYLFKAVETLEKGVKYVQS